ncbi:MAG: M23 family metallopeptidase [Alphaproteobacteria bacterium]|nr:M23 family metallopeptidase [Alphaproteobacteria bacterium]
MARRRIHAQPISSQVGIVLRLALFATVFGAILFASDRTSRLLVALEASETLLGGAEGGAPAVGELEPAIARTADSDGQPDDEAAIDSEGAALHDPRLHAESPPTSSEFNGVPQKVIAVRRGDTLMDILLSVGLPRAEAHEAVSALSGVFDPRGLKPGQEITFTFAPGESGPMVGAWLAARADRDVGLSREPGGRFTALQRDKALTLEPTRAAGMVRSSLYEAGLSAGVPAQIMVELIRAFSFDVDFQREIQPGDAFEVIFDRYRDETGRTVKDGALRHASLLLSGRRLAIYLYPDRDGMADYYNERGESVRKALLKTPIDGARLTSGFGSRMHPILGYSAFHKGVDFGAPSGTPIQAAGDGVVEMSGWFGGYGNYVRLKHNGEYSTAYAHLSRYAPGIKEGARVKQGQIVGYVGTTGRSTGAHLHYEVLRRGAQINPMGVKFPTGRKLDGIELVAFKRIRGEVDHLLSTAAVAVQLAARPAEPKPAD